MSQDVHEFFSVAAGWHESGGGNVTAGEMAARAALGFVVLLVLIRFGRRRLMGRIGPFDLVVTMIIGSTLSRGITGNAPLWATIAACAAVIGVHWALAAVASRSPAFSRWVEGEPVELVRDGQPDRDHMRRHVISEPDLHEALRLEGKKTDLASVAVATLERSGNISVVVEPATPRTVG